MRTEKRGDSVHLPVIALRGLTVFPGIMLNFEVGREISVRALEGAMAVGSQVFLVGQRDISVEDPTPEDLYSIGTISAVRQILRMPERTVRVMVEGRTRGILRVLERTESCFEAEVEELIPQPSPGPEAPDQEALIRSTCELFQRYVKLSPKISQDLMLQVLSSRDPGYLADFIAQNIPMRNENKQAVLEELDPMRRLTRLYRMLGREVEILSLELDIENRARARMEENQRDYFLREQMKVIRQELGEREDGDDIEGYRSRVEKASIPEEVRRRLNREVERLSHLSFTSAEASSLRNYLDLALELPWTVATEEERSVSAVRRVLEEDHFGLEKVKERILEYTAVRQLAPDLKGQALCLVGPPGVGKTSVAISMARAMNRRLARISLGGVSDEAEIRGHRRTYVGAMPGRIIKSILHAGTRNPLLLLDEIDKLGQDRRGDPASALLEVLDAEQNRSFRDNFLEIPFDLSDVLFVTTANTTETIPRPLLDRMEIIELGSYTDEEKVHIARDHLLKKQRASHGLDEARLQVPDDTVRRIITAWTRESGVRILERRLAAICRKAAMELLERGEGATLRVEPSDLERFLGPPRYHPERETMEERVGVVNGLAWTSTGGELLEVEVNVVPGSGKVELTGNLGNVMKESAQAALSFIRSQAERLRLPRDFYRETDIHVHFPEGAVPKDGPSAGIAITTAMVSALTGRPVRAGLAMTGEVTLRGRVLAIGGLKEKTMAAYRCGIREVLLPADNERDLEEIDRTVRAGVRFVPVERAEQVLEAALLPAPEPEA